LQRESLGGPYPVGYDPVYVDVAARRWQAFIGTEATLEGQGRTIDEVVRRRAEG
jgi:hypothetical protein